MFAMISFSLWNAWSGIWAESTKLAEGLRVLERYGWPLVRAALFYARIANRIGFAKVLCNHKHRTFTINFRCQPFWYAETVTPIALTTSDAAITNPGNVFSEPVITT